MAERRSIPLEQIFTIGIDDFWPVSGLSETQVWKIGKERAIDSFSVGKHRQLIAINHIVAHKRTCRSIALDHIGWEGGLAGVDLLPENWTAESWKILI
jgi:hypothetical protein